jgi:adenine phosphoribosyltransferase
MTAEGLPAAAPSIQDNASRSESQSPSVAASASELASVKKSLHAALRQFPDFPIPGIDFVDILPLFADHALHTSLIRALELQVLLLNGGTKPDVVVGLDARGFLFGPSLALRLGASFAPVRKRGKLPGPTAEAAFEKEYGQDYFQIQSDAIKKGQSVLVVDDIIATGEFALCCPRQTTTSYKNNNNNNNKITFCANVVQQVDLQVRQESSSKTWVEI